MTASKSRLLIISNNVLCENKNNGKTLLSYIDSLDRQNVRQLYFHGDAPSVDGYGYFRITDRDILKGIFDKNKRGRVIARCSADKGASVPVQQRKVRKNDLTKVLRELLWCGKWKSNQLIAWLDEFRPEAVFFVAGDSMFAYAIAQFVVTRYHAKLSVYVTDDYIMPRQHESLIASVRRRLLLKRMKRITAEADAFFTVSEPMRTNYREVLNKDSHVIVNMTDSLQRREYCQENETIRLVYAGSLYYGRDEVIRRVADEIAQINPGLAKKAKIDVYTNKRMTREDIEKLESSGCCSYGGALDRDQLTVELNRADILLFVESFDKDQIEKTKYSLSTKVPEYLSVGKPILAIGPSGIGSIEYLKDTALCVDDLSSLSAALKSLFGGGDSDVYGEKAVAKYNRFHDKEKNQKEFINLIL